MNRIQKQESWHEFADTEVPDSTIGHNHNFTTKILPSCTVHSSSTFRSQHPKTKSKLKSLHTESQIHQKNHDFTWDGTAQKAQDRKDRANAEQMWIGYIKKEGANLLSHCRPEGGEKHSREKGGNLHKRSSKMQGGGSNLTKPHRERGHINRRKKTVAFPKNLGVQ